MISAISFQRQPLPSQEMRATEPSKSVEGARPNPASLESQLEIYSKKLADCVNCSTSKTIEGKKNIQTLLQKVNEIKAQLKEISDSNKKPATASQTLHESQQSLYQEQGNISKPNNAFGLALGGNINAYA